MTLTRAAALALALHASTATAQPLCGERPVEAKYLDAVAYGHTGGYGAVLCATDRWDLRAALLLGVRSPLAACEAMGAEPADSPRRAALRTTCLALLDGVDRDLGAAVARYTAADESARAIAGSWSLPASLRSCEEARATLRDLAEIVDQPEELPRVVRSIEELAAFAGARRCPGLELRASDLSQLAARALSTTRGTVLRYEGMRVALEATVALIAQSPSQGEARVARCVADVRAWSLGSAWPQRSCRAAEPARRQLVSEEAASWLASRVASSASCDAAVDAPVQPVRTLAHTAHRLVCALGAAAWQWSPAARCAPTERAARDPVQICSYARASARDACRRGAPRRVASVHMETLCRGAPVSERLELALDLAGIAQRGTDALAVLATLASEVESMRSGERAVYWEAMARISARDDSDSGARERAIAYARRWREAAEAGGDAVAAARADALWAGLEADLGQSNSALRRAQRAALVLARHRRYAAAARARRVEAEVQESVGRPSEAHDALERARESLGRAREIDLLGGWERCRASAEADDSARLRALSQAWELEADRLEARASGSWDATVSRAFAAIHGVEDGCSESCRVLVAAAQTVFAAADAGVVRAETVIDHLRADLDARNGDPAAHEWTLRAELHARLGAMAARRGQLTHALDHYYAAFGASGKLLEAHERGTSPRRMARLLAQLERHEALFFSSMREHAGDARVRRLALAVAYQRQGRVDGLPRRPDPCNPLRRAADWSEDALSAWTTHPAPHAICGAPGEGSLRRCLEDARLEVLAHFVEFAGADGTRRFVAVTIDDDGVIRWIDLGPASDIDVLALDVRRAASALGGQPERAARALTRRVFRQALGHVRRGRLGVVLDGSLRGVPLLLLHDEHGEWIERIEIVTLPSARALMGRSSGYSFGRSVLFADPAPQNNHRRSASRRRSLPRDGAWWALPGTRAEVRRVAALLERADVRVGRDATETDLYHLARDARILHLATHGSSAPAPLESSDYPVERLGFLQLAPSGAPGALSQPSHWPDGRVTAEEIAENLDLRGTELAVLSACESGGPPAAGRGYGELRHAFLAAGASTVVSSLWTVDDEATSDLMTRYYVELSRGCERHDALARAAAAVRRRYPHPHYWAAFQVLGAPGPVCMHGWPAACR